MSNAPEHVYVTVLADGRRSITLEPPGKLEPGSVCVKYCISSWWGQDAQLSCCNRRWVVPNVVGII